MSTALQTPTFLLSTIVDFLASTESEQICFAQHDRQCFDMEIVQSCSYRLLGVNIGMRLWEEI